MPRIRVDCIIKMKRWCSQFSAKRSEGNVTHTCMDGGSYAIPSDMTDEFWRLYASAAEAGEALHFVEIKSSPCFRFFVDFDAMDARALNESEQRDVARAIYDSVAEVAGPEIECVACSTTTKQTAKGVKTGMHLVWDLCVDADLATLLAEKVEHDLAMTYGTREAPANPWSDVIDKSVYGKPQTGLRVKYSSKPDDPARVYAPAYAFSGDKVYEIADEPILDQLRRVSIRAPPASRVAEVDRDALARVVVAQDELAKLSKAHSCADFVDYDNADLATFLCLGYRHLSRTKIKRVSKVIGKRNKAKCYIVHVDSKFCENLGRCHGSNNVYYVVTSDGIRQRCYCTCDTTAGRRDGRCSEFQGRLIPLPEALKGAMFGTPKVRSAPTSATDLSKLAHVNRGALQTSVAKSILESLVL